MRGGGGPPSVCNTFLSGGQPFLPNKLMFSSGGTVMTDEKAFPFQIEKKKL